MWWAAVDSNHLPPRYQHGALPVELAAHGLGKGSCPERNGRTGTLPWQESALGGGAGRVSGAFGGPAPTRAGYIAGVISYTEILPPDLSTGHAFASSTDWLSDSALRIE